MKGFIYRVGVKIKEWGERFHWSNLVRLGNKIKGSV